MFKWGRKGDKNADKPADEVKKDEPTADSAAPKEGEAAATEPVKDATESNQAETDAAAKVDVPVEATPSAPAPAEPQPAPAATVAPSPAQDATAAPVPSSESGKNDSNKDKKDDTVVDTAKLDQPKGKSVDLSATASAAFSTRLDVETQMAGNLWKKDTAGSSTWNQRYFVLKDGFLMYYAERKTPMLQFDMHPKGAVPLDGVEIETLRSGPTKTLQSALRISHPSFGTKSVLLCAASDEEREKWMAALNNSRFVTYTNAVTSASQIESMKKHTAEVELKLEKAEKSLVRRTEQVSQLVKQNKGLMAAIERFQAQTGMRVPIDNIDADDTHSGAGAGAHDGHAYHQQQQYNRLSSVSNATDMLNTSMVVSELLSSAPATASNAAAAGAGLPLPPPPPPSFAPPPAAAAASMAAAPPPAFPGAYAPPPPASAALSAAQPASHPHHVHDNSQAGGPGHAAHAHLHAVGQHQHNSSSGSSLLHSHSHSYVPSHIGSVPSSNAASRRSSSIGGIGDDGVHSDFRPSLGSVGLSATSYPHPHYQPQHAVSMHQMPTQPLVHAPAEQHHHHQQQEHAHAHPSLHVSIPGSTLPTTAVPPPRPGAPAAPAAAAVPPVAAPAMPTHHVAPPQRPAAPAPALPATATAPAAPAVAGLPAKIAAPARPAAPASAAVDASPVGGAGLHMPNTRKKANFEQTMAAKSKL